MAISKSGGTRQRLRGKIGNDIYSIGRDGKGKKQQVARSLPEVVSNPRTLAQVRSRMILNGVSKLVQALRPIISNSFDGIPAGQPSISHFRSLAIKAFTEDSKLTSPKFGYVDDGSDLIPNGDIVISSGKAVMPLLFLDGMGNQYYEGYGEGGFDVWIPWRKKEGSNVGANITGQEALDLIFKGDPRNAYTYVGIIKLTNSQTGELIGYEPNYCRVSYNPNNEQKSKEYDEWAANANSGGVLEGNIDVTLYGNFGEYSDGVSAYVRLNPLFYRKYGNNIGYKTIAQAVIWSEYVPGKGYIHSNSAFQLKVQYQEGYGEPLKEYQYNPAPLAFADALATYPIGSSAFLNGGEL